MHRANRKRPRHPMEVPRPFPILGLASVRPARPVSTPAKSLYEPTPGRGLASWEAEWLEAGPATVTAPERTHAARYQATIRRSRRFALTYLKFACPRPLRHGGRAGAAPGAHGQVVWNIIPAATLTVGTIARRLRTAPVADSQRLTPAVQPCARTDSQRRWSRSAPQTVMDV